jgi:hypothetical protein
MKGWNTYFHKLKKIWIYKKSLNRLLFPKWEQQGKGGSSYDEKRKSENEKVGNIWSNGEILYLTIPQGEMELKFAKM